MAPHQVSPKYIPVFAPLQSSFFLVFCVRILNLHFRLRVLFSDWCWTITVLKCLGVEQELVLPKKLQLGYGYSSLHVFANKGLQLHCHALLVTLFVLFMSCKCPVITLFLRLWGSPVCEWFCQVWDYCRFTQPRDAFAEAVFGIWGWPICAVSVPYSSDLSNTDHYFLRSWMPS